MRRRYFLGFAAAVGLAAPADAQFVTGRGVPQTGRPQSPVVNRMIIPTPLMASGSGPAATPIPAVTPTPAAAVVVVAPPADAPVQPTVAEDIWAAPGTPRPQPAQVRPPTVTQVRHQEPKPPAVFPDVPAPPSFSKPAPPPVVSKPAPAPMVMAKPAGSVPAFAPYTSAALPSSTLSTAALPGTSVPCPTPTACPPMNCEPACPCGPVPSAWVRAEWLFWATQGQNLPPLATGAPIGTARELAGRLNSPSSTVLYGGDRVNNEFRSGVRLSGGFWFDECGKWGIDGDFFFLGRTREGFAAGSNADGSPIITRPFFNSLTGAADAELVSYPGILRGATTASAQSELIGGGVNAVRNLWCDPCGRVNLIAGYRYLNLKDEVTITEDLTALAGQTRVPAGSRYQITDRFRTENHFHGGVIGLSGEYKHAFWFVGGRASVALGSVTQITEIRGTTTITPPGGPPTTYAGGLLAQPSNIGRYEQSRFAVLPEVSLRTGVQVTDHCKAYVGYNFLYLSSVARAGDQIDGRVNTNQLPPQTVFGGPRVPAYLGATTGFWAQGVSVGMQFDF